LTLLAVAALGLAGCATMRVSSFAERGADLSRYRTYGWGQSAEFTGDPRLDANPFFHERVRAAVEQQLARRGLEQTTADGPELIVHYHANISEEIDVSLVDRETGNCTTGSDCRPYVYDAGTLVIDFVDARTKALVWRGWAEDTMDGAIDDQRVMEQKIDQAVARILQRFPARL
jgi:hypothetical protein